MKKLLHDTNKLVNFDKELQWNYVGILNVMITEKRKQSMHFNTDKLMWAMIIAKWNTFQSLHHRQFINPLFKSVSTTNHGMHGGLTHWYEK